MGMSVWLAVLTMVDSECYAEGADVSVTVHATRSGAAEAIRERFRANRIDRAHGEDDGLYVPTITGLAGDEYGEFWEDDRFFWTWSLYPRSIES